MTARVGYVHDPALGEGGFMRSPDHDDDAELEEYDLGDDPHIFR